MCVCHTKWVHREMGADWIQHASTQHVTGLLLNWSAGDLITGRQADFWPSPVSGTGAGLSFTNLQSSGVQPKRKKIVQGVTLMTAVQHAQVPQRQPGMPPAKVHSLTASLRGLTVGSSCRLPYMLRRTAPPQWRIEGRPGELLPAGRPVLLLLADCWQAPRLQWLAGCCCCFQCFCIAGCASAAAWDEQMGLGGTSRVRLFQVCW